MLWADDGDNDACINDGSKRKIVVIDYDIDVEMMQIWC